MKTYQELYEQGRDILEQAGIAEASLDARLLLEDICNTKRHDLLVHGDRIVQTKEELQYFSDIQKRAKRIPLQHITGYQEFMGLDFRVTKDVLIPRQDTEVLVEEVMRYLHDGMKILDLCTGSGCIITSLIKYSNECTGVGVDISKNALEIARENAESILGEKSDQVTFLESNLYDQVDGKFDIIVSNPPYIESSVIPTLMPEVREHEPSLALDGSEDGLFFYREIIKKSHLFLKRGGMLFFEIGYNQAKQVSDMLEETRYSEIQVLKDFAGNDRVVFATFIE